MQELKFQKDVVAGLLGNDNRTQTLQEFRNLLYNKFIAFANTISLDKEAEAIIMLQTLKQSLKLLVRIQRFIISILSLLEVRLAQEKVYLLVLF